MQKVRIGEAEKIEHQAQTAEEDGEGDEADADDQGRGSLFRFARECALLLADPFFHMDRRLRSHGRLV
jgi:hypothetical protein